MKEKQILRAMRVNFGLALLQATSFAFPLYHLRGMHVHIPHHPGGNMFQDGLNVSNDSPNRRLNKSTMRPDNPGISRIQRGFPFGSSVLPSGRPLNTLELASSNDSPQINPLAGTVESSSPPPPIPASRLNRRGKPRVQSITSLPNYKSVLSAARKNDRIVVTKFFASWCRSCKSIQARYASLSGMYDEKEVIFCEVEMNEKSREWVINGLGIGELQ